MLGVRKAKRKILKQDHTQAEAWVYRPETLPKIKFSDLVRECAMTCGETPNKTKGVTAAFVDRISHYLQIGRSVEIEGIGTFKPTISSKSYASKDEMEAPGEAIKEVKIVFYPHKPLVEAAKSNGFEYMPSLDDK